MDKCVGYDDPRRNLSTSPRRPLASSEFSHDVRDGRLEARMDDELPWLESGIFALVNEV